VANKTKEELKNLKELVNNRKSEFSTPWIKLSNKRLKSFFPGFFS